MKIQNYKKELDFSYSYGFYPTVELLKHRKNEVIKIVYSSHAQNSRIFDEIKAICQKEDILFEHNDKFVNALANKENTFVIGVFKKFKADLKPNQNHVVLFRPSDVGNLGMIIRSCLGLGVDNLAIISPAVDVFNPKVIRATMGAFFNINFEYFNSLEDYFAKFQNKAYLFDIKGNDYLSKVKLEKPFSLVFGNEGKGLPDEALKLGEVLKIEQTDKIDSLNLANSVSIALYWAKIH